MGVFGKLRNLDARAGMSPAAGETWAAFYTRKSKRRGYGRLPLISTLGELSDRIQVLETRVADLEGVRRDAE